MNEHKKLKKKKKNPTPSAADFHFNWKWLLWMKKKLAWWWGILRRVYYYYKGQSQQLDSLYESLSVVVKWHGLSLIIWSRALFNFGEVHTSYSIDSTY